MTSWGLTLGDGTTLQADATVGGGGGIDASIASTPSAHGVSAFHLPAVTVEPVKAGSWVGSVAAGASVNCMMVSACWHGCGTHTECVGHMLPGDVSLFASVPPPPPLMPAHIITVTPRAVADVTALPPEYITAAAGDVVIDAATVSAGLDAALRGLPAAATPAALAAAGATTALLIRTLPNDDAVKRRHAYSGTNPPYLTPSGIDVVLSHGYRHLLVDLPSLDRENDGGNLQSHRAWWGLPQPIPKAKDSGGGTTAPSGGVGVELGPEQHRTVTELILVPTTTCDGLYLLNLQLPALHSDAAPSRPLLYPVTHINGVPVMPTPTSR